MTKKNTKLKTSYEKNDVKKIQKTILITNQINELHTNHLEIKIKTERYNNHE